MTPTVIKLNDANKDSKAYSNLTSDQKKACDSLIPWAKNPFNEKDFKRGLCGPGGVGKTYTLKVIINSCGLAYSKIGLAAPSHKACRVISESLGKELSSISVNTLTSDLGLQPKYEDKAFDPNNPPFAKKGKTKMTSYALYIIDEASMINYSYKSLLEKIAKENKIKILYVGDSYQLPPINERKSSAFQNLKIEYLNQIVRQSDDNPLRILLNMLRQDIDKNTFTCLQYIISHPENIKDGKGYKTYGLQGFVNKVMEVFGDGNITKNTDYVKLIAYTNQAIDNWNKIIRNTLIENSSKSIVNKHDLFMCYDTKVNDFMETIIINSEEYIVKDIVNYVNENIQMRGFMVTLQAIHGGNVTDGVFIVDHTDRQSIINYTNHARKLKQKGLQGQGWDDYYNFRKENLIITRVLNGNTIEFKNDLDYAFALTSHKSQGSTFDNVFVDINNIVYDKNGNPYFGSSDINRRLYVAISRAKNLAYLCYGE